MPFRALVCVCVLDVGALFNSFIFIWLKKVCEFLVSVEMNTWR